MELVKWTFVPGKNLDLGIRQISRPKQIKYSYQRILTLNTLKKHQKIRTIAIFQKFLTQEMHCSQWRINNLTIPPSSVKI